MRALIQRVSRAEVIIDGCPFSEIGRGLLVLLGIEQADTEEDIEWLTSKIVRLRIFDDPQGVMNLDVEQVEGEVMVVSQFTLHASTRKGNRPSYIRAAGETVSKPLYEKFLMAINAKTQGRVAAGQFGAMMQVGLVNDGPVTIWIDTKNRE